MPHALSNGILFDCRDHALGTFFPLLDLQQRMEFVYPITFEATISFRDLTVPFGEETGSC